MVCLSLLFYVFYFLLDSNVSCPLSDICFTSILYFIPALFVILFIIPFNPNIDNTRHVKKVVNKINEIKEVDEVVLICPKHFAHNFAYYYDIDIFKDCEDGSSYGKIIDNLTDQNIIAINTISDVNLDNYKKVIFLDAGADFSSPNNDILNTLTNNYSLQDTHKIYAIFNIYEFCRD